MIRRRHLAGILGEKAHVLPRSWYIHEEQMANNILLAKGDSLRLYDQYGRWQFSVEDGNLEGQASDVPRPGWPKGRRTPKNHETSERRPWSGWDRVTAAELVAGEDTYNMMALRTHPYTRAAPGDESWLFPQGKGWGARLKRQTKDFLLEPALFEHRNLLPDGLRWETSKWSGISRHAPSPATPCSPRVLDYCCGPFFAIMPAAILSRPEES